MKGCFEMLNIKENINDVAIRKRKASCFQRAKRLRPIFFICLAMIFAPVTSGYAASDLAKDILRNSHANLYMMSANGQFNGFNSMYQAWANLASGMPGLHGVLIRGQQDEGGDTPQPQLQPQSRPRQWELWGGATYTYMKAPGVNGEAGVFHGYRVHRPGFLGGLKRELSDTSSGGIVIVYAAPNFMQQGTADDWDGGYRVDIDIYDFQVALHYDKKFWENWELSLFAGGGTQWGNWLRVMNDDGNIYNYRANSSGNTFTASVYLARTMNITSSMRMSGLIGLESEHSWIYGAPESGVKADSLSNLDLDGAFQPYKCRDIQYSRNTMRLGLRFAYESPWRKLGSNFQIFYGYGMGAESATATIFDAEDIFENNMETSYTVKGLPIGRHSLALGGNLHFFLDDAETLTLQMDYTAVLYQNLTAQNVALTLAKRY